MASPAHLPSDQEIFALLEPVDTVSPDVLLAKTHAPVIRFDRHEPFLPSVIGYTIFRSDAQSDSFPRVIRLQENVKTVIEYAIWWDWDIQHLYELEHVWVYLDADNRLIDAEASWHGGYHRMVTGEGEIPQKDGRLVIYSEPGKHAFAPSPDWLTERKSITDAASTTHSGISGVHITHLFDGIMNHLRNPTTNQLVHTYLNQLTFSPAYDFSQEFDLADGVFVPWAHLQNWIPQRVNWWTQVLHDTIPYHARRVLRIAHRGGIYAGETTSSEPTQENSLNAFTMAANTGVDMVETDIRVTADHIPVIFHDESLMRVYGMPQTISELTLAELQAQTDIPTLEEAAQHCHRLGIGMYLDIKSFDETALKLTFEAIDRHWLTKFTIFASFRPDWVAEIKAQRPDVMTSILFSSTHVEPVQMANAINADYVHPCWERFDSPQDLLTHSWLAAVREAELGIICWHEERPEVIKALQKLGVHGICSDDPELLNEYLHLWTHNSAKETGND